MEIILASQSPRRRELLKKMDISFSVRNIDISEEIYNEENPQDYVLRMAETKAAEGARTEKNALVIGADTIVCIDNEILGKPKDKEDAAKILNKIQGRKHFVFTGVSLNLNNGEKIVSFIEKTEVNFAKMSHEEILNYIETGEPMDKAGAYGIQDKGALFVKSINGCFYNVMGLPVRRIYEELNILIKGEENGVESK
ncbi:MAG: Maf family protein [Eubacteriales bacterium]|jgi:septum formation protein|nr:Maf family protein [Eubacteriales bacterium]